MDQKSERRMRDVAIWLVRLSTFVSAAAALGLTWAFSGLAQAYFSGKPPAPAPTVVPAVPVAAAPVQQPPKVEQTIVHHRIGRELQASTVIGSIADTYLEGAIAASSTLIK